MKPVRVLPLSLNVPLSEQERFTQELQLHRAPLRAWLSHRFPSLDVDDLVQESCMRAWRVHAVTPLVSIKAFLYVTARNLALDQLRRPQAVSIESIAEMERVFVSEEGEGIAETVGKNQELELLARAIQALPDRCRQVLTLRKIYGLSQKEIAAQLGISEHTVEAQVANGVRRCAEFLSRFGLP